MPLSTQNYLVFLRGFCLIIGLFFAGEAFSQCTLRGTISDNRGELLPMVNVYLRDNISVGTTSDFNGKYSLNLPAGSHVVKFSYAGMEAKLIEVDASVDEVFVLDVVLNDATVQIAGGAEIVVKADRGGEPHMEKIKKNSASSINYISAATFKKGGYSTVSDAVKRVTGVSTVGGYVSVRGLMDRYVKTTVNGSTVPTLDPFSNNIKMDIFPTGLVDAVVIMKTQTPDLAGDWAGAFISIESKDFPDRLQVNFTQSFGYNTQSTFKEVISSQGSDTDWLGFDDGFRDIPDGVATTQDDFPGVVNPDLWQQFQYIGLDDDLETYGINGESDISDGDIYHQVALVEMGFLGAAQINDEFAVNQAIEEYNATYSSGYFFTGYNSELEKVGTSFNNTWFNEKKKAPMNFGQSLSIGNQVELFQRPLGFIVGYRYASSNAYDPNSTLQRTSFSESVPEGGALPNLRDYKQQVSWEDRGWSALANVSYKIHKHHNISFMFMPNFKGQNKARHYEGLREDIAEVTLGDDQLYEERRQLLYQLETEHFLPGREIKILFNSSFTDGKRNILDFKDVRYLWDGEQYLFNSTFNPDRRFRYMDEDLSDSRLSIEIPFARENKDVKGKFKLGGAYMYNKRTNQQVVYTMLGLNEEDLAMGFDEVMAPGRFEIVDSTAFDLYYVNSSTFDDSDIGFRKITSGFGMIDITPIKPLRIVGGARVEHTDLMVDIRKFYDENTPVDSPDRYNGNGQLLNPGEINQVDVLPSVNLIYQIQNNDDRNISLRGNFSKSLARPSFREISGLSQFDYELRARVRGNSDLEMTTVYNYDLRAEAYLKGGHNVSISGFYKEFTNHIELIQTAGEVFTWQNADDSKVYGIELEGKWRMLPSLDLMANLTLVNSQTTITFPEEETRAMFGQAPYTLNGILLYHADSLGLNVTVSYNIQGPKLAVISSSGVAAPDVYELSRHLLDVKISKVIGDHFGVSISGKNLLNAPIRRSYAFDQGYLIDFDRYQRGINFSLSVSYNL